MVSAEGSNPNSERRVYNIPLVRVQPGTDMGDIEMGDSIASFKKGNHISMAF